MLGTTNVSTFQALSMSELSLSLNGVRKVMYNGISAASLDITLSSLGAAASNHNHDSVYSKLNHTHSYLPLSGGTLTGALSFATQNSQTLLGITGQIAVNDFWRIGGAGADNNGYLEIATADDGSEPIYIRQYSGVFTTVRRTATLLDGNGNTSFPGAIWEGGVSLVNKYAAKSHTHNYLSTSGGTMNGEIQMLTKPISWNAASDYAQIHFEGANDDGNLYITLGDDNSPSAIFRWKFWDSTVYTNRARIFYNGIKVENGANYYTDSQVGLITAVQSGAPSTRTLWAY